MSKWTMEKIKSQIKRGDTCSIQGDNHKGRLVLKIYKNDIITHHFQDIDVSRWQNSDINEFEFKFYRNEEEILPKTEREVIKFTEKLVDSIPRFLTDQNEFVRIVGKLKLSRQLGDRLIEEIPNARVLYRYADTLEIARWGNDS